MFMRQLSAGRTFKSIKCVLLNRQPEADTEAEAEAEAGSINSLFGAAQVANRLSQTETSHSQLSVCLSAFSKHYTHTHTARERERDRHTHVPAFSAIAITSNVCCKRLLLYFYLISFAFQLAPLSHSLWGFTLMTAWQRKLFVYLPLLPLLLLQLFLPPFLPFFPHAPSEIRNQIRRKKEICQSSH